MIHYIIVHNGNNVKFNQRELKKYLGNTSLQNIQILFVYCQSYTYQIISTFQINDLQRTFLNWENRDNGFQYATIWMTNLKTVCLCNNYIHGYICIKTL